MQWMVCPRRDLSFGELTCDTPEAFVPVLELDSSESLTMVVVFVFVLTVLVYLLLMFPMKHFLSET